ncbi:MAG TPA: hypothetical protein VJT31_06940 [Rugosimonospora sp.]|nr:hypothetical protein [Rugosimonospora sp.]
MQLRQDITEVPAATASPGRCTAAHALDPRPCEGAPDAVQIVDWVGEAVGACLLHGAVLLASLDRARVYPLGGPEGCAITVYVRARSLAPFDFLTNPGASRLTTAGEAASCRWVL